MGHCKWAGVHERVGMEGCDSAGVNRRGANSLMRIVLFKKLVQSFRRLFCAIFHLLIELARVVRVNEQALNMGRCKWARCAWGRCDCRFRLWRFIFSNHLRLELARVVRPRARSESESASVDTTG